MQSSTNNRLNLSENLFSILAIVVSITYFVNAISPFNHPIVLRSFVLLEFGNCPPLSRTRLHAAVRSVAPCTPYLHNASSCVNLGIHLGSSFGLHLSVSDAINPCSNASKSSALAAIEYDSPNTTADDSVEMSDIKFRLLLQLSDDMPPNASA